MWVMAIFDLPVFTKEQRKAVRVFRKCLILKGFEMLQKSVYIRKADKTYESVISYLMGCLPKEGKISFIKIPEQLLFSSVFIENSCVVPPPKISVAGYVF